MENYYEIAVAVKLISSSPKQFLFPIIHEKKQLQDLREEGRKPDLRRSCEVYSHRMRKQTFGRTWHMQPQRTAAMSRLC